MFNRFNLSISRKLNQTIIKNDVQCPHMYETHRKQHKKKNYSFETELIERVETQAVEMTMMN